MTQELKAQFINRGKSFLWRTGMLAVAFTVAFLTTNLSEIIAIFTTNQLLTLFLIGISGLVLGEVSKLVNNALSAQQ